MTLNGQNALGHRFLYQSKVHMRPPISRL